MENIAATRKAIGLTQAELAQKLGVGQSVIARFEKGSRVADTRSLMAIKYLLLAHLISADSELETRLGGYLIKE